MSDFQYTARHDTQLSWECCQHLQLIFTFFYKLWLPISDTQRVKGRAQIKTVHRTLSCVLWNAFLVKGSEVTKLYTWNNQQ